VKEFGRLFVAVEFADGRIGYYSPQQLKQLGSVEEPERSEVGEANLGFTRTRLPYGSHLCLLPDSQHQSQEAVGRYIAAGLAANDLCICAIPEPYRAGLIEALERLEVETEQAVGRGDLVILANTDVYLQGAELKAEAQLARTMGMFESVANGNGRGMRCFGYPGSVLGSVDLEEWWEYEVRVTEPLRDSGVLTMCGYDAKGIRRSQWPRAESIHPYVLKQGCFIVRDHLVS
jgi:hypothetical protein